MYSVFEMLPRSECLPDSFIYQIFIESYYVPGNTLGAGAAAMHDSQNTRLQGAYILKVVKATSK